MNFFMCAAKNREKYPKPGTTWPNLLSFVGLLSSQSLTLWPNIKLVLVAAAVYR